MYAVLPRTANKLKHVVVSMVYDTSQLRICTGTCRVTNWIIIIIITFTNMLVVKSESCFKE